MSGHRYRPYVQVVTIAKMLVDHQLRIIKAAVIFIVAFIVVVIEISIPWWSSGFGSDTVINWFETGWRSGTVQIGPWTGVGRSAKKVFRGSGSGSVLRVISDGCGIRVADGYRRGVPATCPRVLRGVGRSDRVDARDVVVSIRPVVAGISRPARRRCSVHSPGGRRFQFSQAIC